MDLDELRIAIRNMTRHSPIYKVVRDELKARGNWRYNPRGDPSKGYKNMKSTTSENQF
jgi:hypothetical protein